jgi:nicotinate-nucleotide pyrophosphorylase (carboxylating)
MRPRLETAMTLESTFGEREQSAAAALIALALHEDLGQRGDLTCQALIAPEEQAAVNVVARKAGVLAGSPVGRMVFAALDASIRWRTVKADGERLNPGDVVAIVTGPLASLLSGERTMLNFLTHLSGVATLTRRFVEAVADTGAQILDTRKTLPGYRLLEKYAVRCGGGANHRLGLYDGVLIKDNHLAAWSARKGPGPAGSIAAAVRAARDRLPAGLPIEVEVDSLEQLRDALAAWPDIVLLDNMTCDGLRAAVALRDAWCATTGSGPVEGGRILLEASGGVTLDTVRAIAETGVERISVGALTHSAPALDLAFDWSAAINPQAEA